MSDIEILKRAIEILDGVSVPVSLTEQIAIPVANASSMIKALYNAVLNGIRQKEEEEKKKAEQAPEEATEPANKN